LTFSGKEDDSSVGCGRRYLPFFAHLQQQQQPVNNSKEEAEEAEEVIITSYQLFCFDVTSGFIIIALSHFYCNYFRLCSFFESID